MEFFGMIAKGMMAYADFVWGWPLLIGTSFVAVFMSVRLGFFQFTYFGHVMKNTFGNQSGLYGIGIDTGCRQYRRCIGCHCYWRPWRCFLDVVHRYAGSDRQILGSYPGPCLP